MTSASTQPIHPPRAPTTGPASSLASRQPIQGGQRASPQRGPQHLQSHQQQQMAHPRRPPAHRSVSLLHNSPDSNRQNTQKQQPVPQHAPSLLNPNATKKQGSSGDSGESSDAGKWFEKSNNNVTEGGAALVENDSPFFLRNSSSEEDPPEGHEKDTHSHNTGLPYQADLQRLQTESSTDDFRSVIDDLTVENRKLKTRLKKFEHLYDTHLQDEKLFEIRVHGLSGSKKRELEELLKQFSSTLEDTPSSERSPATTSGPATNSAAALPTRQTHSSNTSSNNLLESRVDPNTSYSHTSTRFADSAYASASLSGQNSAGTAHAQDSSHGAPTTKSALSQHNRNVQSYLQDIPQGLLPKHTTNMSEKTKKKLVVRRLEQIFAGKGAATNGHQQPMQQQEVAQSAAKADRKAVQKSGKNPRAEGIREARIMRKKSDEERVKQVDPAILYEPKPQQSLKPSGAASESASNRSPDQRPTRPLDLDPHRAQVPEENMEYIRHLGFSPPDFEDQRQKQYDGRHGWIYLNLLMNMAQLHTINVTADFVKKAVQGYSSKFELSRDGRKIRWVGGSSITQTSSDGSSVDRTSNNSPDGVLQDAAKKRLKMGNNGSDESVDQSSATGQARDTLAYTPLFFHQKSSSSSEEDSSLNEQTSGPSATPQGANNSPGFVSSGVQTMTSKRRREDGPIIFYNKAQFCTDLSGDRQGVRSGTANHTKYTSMPTIPVGSEADADSRRNPALVDSESRGPMETTSVPDYSDKMDIDNASSTNSAGMDLNFPSSGPSSVGGNAKNPSPSKPIEFEASGLGNVQPDDNFEITVQTSQLRLNQPPSLGAAHHAPPRSKAYPRRIHDALEAARVLARENAALRKDLAKVSAAHRAIGRAKNMDGVAPSTDSSEPRVRKQIISSHRRELPASVLPPPSYVYGTFGPSSGETDSDTDMDDSDDVPTSPRVSMDGSPFQPPGALPQMFDFPDLSPERFPDGCRPDGSEGTDADSLASENESRNDDQSVDFLAAARELDPDSIRAREREYNADMAERFAEEIPAGSSAATAGGGSGFNSPAVAQTDSGNGTSSDSVRSEESDEIEHSAASPQVPKATSSKDQRESVKSGSTHAGIKRSRTHETWTGAKAAKMNRMNKGGK